MIEKIKEMLKMNKTSISLLYSYAQLNHKFYQDLVVDFFTDSNKRHKKYPVIKSMTFGVALCRMPLSPDQYLRNIDSTARRNYRKSLKMGYTFSLIDYNKHLDEIWEIRKSAKVRQGKVDEEFLQRKPRECKNPKSKSNLHDYPYFGVFSPDGKLVSYAGCLICGQLAMIEHIYGHKDYEKDRVVPRLIVDIGMSLYEKYPNAFNFGYGTYFGSMPEMKRFKRKFGFLPYCVKWEL